MSRIAGVVGQVAVVRRPDGMGRHRGARALAELRRDLRQHWPATTP